MGYAKLNYSASANNAQVLYELVQVITGNITSNASLTYANVNLSVIVNTLGSGNNWTTIYGVPYSTANNASYVLRSTCVDTSKYHFARLFAVANSVKNNMQLMSVYGDAGVSITTVTSATSSTSVSNESYYPESSSGMSRYVIKADSGNPAIYVNWSKYHIVLYGLSGNAPGKVTAVMGTFQYPETATVQFLKSQPICQLVFQSNSGNTVIDRTAPTLNQDGPTGILFQGPAYEPFSQTAFGVYNFAGNLTTTLGFGTCLPFKWDPQPGVDSTGSTAYPFVPLYWANPQKGVPAINLSTYSKFYRTYSAAGQPETLITVGSDTYVYLTVGANTVASSGNCGIVMLRA